MVKNKNNKKQENAKLKPREKLLKYLIEHKEPATIKQASKAIVVDYKNVYGYVEDLTASGAIVQKVMGKSKPIEVNLSPNQEIFSVEEKRTLGFLSKNLKLKLIQEDVKEINYPFIIVLVFGSYAKGTNTQTSDIDLCVISDNKDKTRELYEKLRLLSLKLEIHEFSTKEFISMIEKKQNNLGNEIVKSNVILYGVENYYNLISKWMKKE